MNEREYRREYVLDQAIVVGKFPESRREHYRREWERDPAGTEHLIASLASGLTPVQASALLGQGDPESMLSIARTLFPELRQPRPLHQGGTLASAPVPAPVPATVAQAPAQGERRRPAVPAEAAPHAQVDAAAPPTKPSALEPEVVAGWTEQLFPEVAERRSAPPSRVVWADD